MEIPTSPAGAKVPVSVCIPTLNEAANLPRCLQHLSWADEVVVIDSRSTDQTVAISESHGARVVPFDWDGQWPKKRNWALRNVEFKHPWIFIVDADEVIVPELAAEIAEAIRDPVACGFYVNRRFIFMGKWLKHCGYYPSWNLRLLKRGFGEYERLTEVGDTQSGDNEVHEHLVVNGPTKFLKSDMLHYAFPTIGIFMEKHNRYSNWEALVQFRGASVQAGEMATVLSSRRRLKNLSRRLPFRPIQRFLYAYVFKLGFLDGRAGYVFCRLLAIYEFLSVMKFEEMRGRERR